MKSLDDLVEMGLEALKDYDPDGYLDDAIHEIADGLVPVYNWELFELLADPRVWGQDISDYASLENMLQAAALAAYLAIEEGLYAALPTTNSRTVGEALEEVEK